MLLVRLYSSPNILKGVAKGMKCSRIGKRSYFKILVGNALGKSSVWWPGPNDKTIL